MKRAAALALLLVAAGVGAADALELRVPKATLRALAEPDGWKSREAAEAIRQASPEADRVRTGGDPGRFFIAWTLPGDLEVRLSARRRDAYRLLRGTTEGVERFLAVPAGYTFDAARAEGDELLLVLSPPAAPPAAAAGEPVESRWGWLRPKVTQTLRGLLSERYQVPARTAVDPENRIVDLPRETTEAEARYDLTLEWDAVTLWGKPRARWNRDVWRDGPRDGESDVETDLLLLEGGVKARAGDSLFGSYARENLQWGPAQLLSPSNPFFLENGRANPVREIPGMDFARLVWLPAPGWTASWISNTGRGEAELGGLDWHPSHALKVDYLGFEASGSLLAYGGPDAASSLRGYGQWTVSDALLVHGEFSLSKGTRRPYPVSDAGPLGGHLEASREHDEAVLPVLLAGAAYTFEVGPTVTLEYVFNGEGYHDSEADAYFDLAHRLGAAVSAGLLPPPRDLDTSARLLRRHYLFAQYVQTEIFDRLSVTLRWTQNLDDRSALATGFAEYSLSDRWRLFGFGAGGTGGNRDEYGSVLRWMATAGVEFSAL